jgi:hypothetical protein
MSDDVLLKMFFLIIYLELPVKQIIPQEPDGKKLRDGSDAMSISLAG